MDTVISNRLVSDRLSADEIAALRNKLMIIRAELGAALVQSCDHDDQIIIGHVRKAFEAAREVQG